MTLRSSILALSLSVFSLTAPAAADCLWDDPAGLKARFDRYVAERVPKACKAETDFMHEEAFAVDANTVKYEMMVATGDSCFAQIAEAVTASIKKGAKPQCGPDRAQAVEVYPGADKYLLFSFKVSEAHAREAGWLPVEGNADQASCEFADVITIPRKKGRHPLPEAHAYKLQDGSIVFLGRLTVDADGSPHAYHPDNKKGLDDKENAGGPGHWAGIATDNCAEDGDPVIQGPNDPAPGYYVTPTTMRASTKVSCEVQSNYVDAEKIPFVALPPKVARILTDKAAHTTRGNAVVVANPSGVVKPAVFADQSPAYGRGEGSIKLVSELDYSPNARNGGTEVRELVYVVLPQRLGFPADAKAVKNGVTPLFEAWGGEKRLAACRAELLKAAR
jgi:hypothetical protein